MPLPTPKKDEKEKDFVSRAIAFQKRENPNMDNTQAAAIAYSTWRKAKGIKADDQLKKGIAVEAEHKDVYDKLQKWSKEEGIPLPISEKELYTMIAKQHIDEIKDYYTRLAKMEKDADGIQAAYELSERAQAKNEIMLFPFGEFEHPQYGALKFNDKFFNQIIDNYNNDVLHTKPFIDKEHQMGEALGWFDTSPYIVKGLGLMIQPTWTDKGKAILADRTYRYFSPWYEDFTDASTGKKYKNVLRGGAVTNIPFIKTMPAIVDDAGKFEEERSSVKYMLSELKYGDKVCKEAEPKGDEADEVHTTPEKIKTGVKKMNAEQAMAEMKKHLELDEGATFEDMVAKIQAMKAKKEEGNGEEENESAEKEMEQGEANGAAKNKLDAQPEKLNDKKQMSEQAIEVKKLHEQVARMSMELLSEKCNQFLDESIRAGKIKPADKAKWEKRYLSDPKGIKEIVEDLPRSFELSEMGSDYDGGEISDSKDPLVILSEEASKISSDKKIDFSIALSEARKKFPKLDEAYIARYRKGGR